ncbi:probable ATP-dependent RNA helicase DHX34 isoform X2 [Aplysia californica]|uniref:Probable ATP-dependent RNA helicase DHX34 isoform X2 n=1 Tax=Aplysia californica TaxID=6500 RepID=A0ABM1VPQ2_APLCA|nr:probable ATP-dependent RNA helicase DHX34 isoform X2 [Aplysia californica]
MDQVEIQKKKKKHKKSKSSHRYSSDSDHEKVFDAFDSTASHSSDYDSHSKSDRRSSDSHRKRKRKHSRHGADRDFRDEDPSKRFKHLSSSSLSEKCHQSRKDFHGHKNKKHKRRHEHVKHSHRHVDKICNQQHISSADLSNDDSSSDSSVPQRSPEPVKYPEESQVVTKKDTKSSPPAPTPSVFPKQPPKPPVRETLDYNFDFLKYKTSLGKIFFRDSTFSNITQRGSKEHDDFWAFVKRYLDFQRKKAEKGKDDKAKASAKSRGQMNLPQNYDVQYKINISFVCRDFDVFLKKNRLVDYQTEKELTRDRVAQFRSILIHYLDFQQKQKFQKLHKIRLDQRNLPIYQFKRKILDLVKKHQVVVVAGDTGCGKSTQVPQYLLEAGFEKIACTQPRRIACISLSKRVGYETLNEYGSQVAYQVRFEKSKTASTKILFLTEGLLLRQMSSDPLLEMYSVVVIDEVHERHIYTDFLLGVLKCVLKQRADLKLVLMSATINISLFSQYFNDAPVLKYPAGERGDLLIFLSGMSEIMAVVEAARAYAQQMKRWIVLPLHSALSVEEQDKVFDIAPDGVRKCIVSTNIAETSVTIDGVRFIVDSGKVKEMSFDPKYKMRRLQEFWISRASSEQRKGRAGRTGPGVCYRLYDESDYDAFQDYSTPELQRVPLDSLILQMISMGLPNARKFPFIEPPAESSLENSIVFLKEQGALASDESLTPIGQMLSMLPVDVVIGKMLIMGSVFNMIDPVLSITAAMSVQSPFTNRAYTDHEAITARKPLESEHGDPFTLLNAFDEWIQVKAQGQGTRKWSRRRGLEEQRFYEMTKLKRQFKDLLRDHHLLDGGEERQHYLTSEQRRAQHGERKRLGELKKEKMRERKRRKVLTLEDEDYQVSDGEEDGKEGNDIKDLEFRLSNDLNQLQETSNRSRSFTLRDVNLMKIILCSGIYPQVAIADDCNTYKRDSEQAFHTKSKPFILLHPTSIFTGQPELLIPKDSSGKVPAPSDLKNLLSSKHELLSYVSLLETNNKPYLVNLMRVPALQTITLFSNSIDTNADCTRLICDEWMEVKFPSLESAELVVSSIMQLRSTWTSLLKVRLQDTFEGIEEERRVSPRAKQLERLLASKLTEFLNSDIVYSLRRVLPAEMQRIYVGPGKDLTSASGSSKFIKTDASLQEHPVKGGVKVTEYLNFNCLLDESSASVWGEFTVNMQRHWVCPQCNRSMIVSVLERLQHEAECGSEGGEGLKQQEAAESEREKQNSGNPKRKAYFCPECEEHLNLTTIEILKHRKSHIP